ncbi:hypothetical protein TNCV_448481 [Trichonephila clavipes]|nr:hypothetical protein TNCV_448481 [Trichonephila clavipes]
MVAGGTCQQNQRSGRPRRTNARQDRMIVRRARTSPSVSLSTIQRTTAVSSFAPPPRYLPPFHGRQIQAPQNIADLEQQLVNFRQNVPQNDIRNLYHLYQDVYNHVSPPGTVPPTTDFNIQAVIDSQASSRFPMVCRKRQIVFKRKWGLLRIVCHILIAPRGAITTSYNSSDLDGVS